MEHLLDMQQSEKTNHDRALQGLTSAEVLERRKRFGENRLPEEKRVSIWKILLEQIKSPLIYIILAAAGVSLALGEMSDFAIIMLVVVADVILGFLQEYKAQCTYVALKGLLRPTTTVIRDGNRAEVEIWELVPGDLVILNAGEKAPGDGTIIESTRISMDESILTGESEPVNKQEVSGEIRTQYLDTEVQPKDQSHLVYMGATVVTGRGILRIDQIGTNTELGKIASSLSEQQEADTPFQLRLKSFSSILTKLVIGFTLLILTVGLISGSNFLSMLRTSIILAIAAVPEGLLIAVTVIQVLGMRRILNRKGLVKKLAAVETLGSVTVICSDKTGTLTEGRMRVCNTDFSEENRALDCMVFCNDLEGPVDIALWQYAQEKLSENPQELSEQAERLGEELFSSETKFMIAEVTGGTIGASRMFFLKGAPEIVLTMCSIDEALKRQVMEQIDNWAGQGLRLLGLAYRAEGTMDNRTGYVWAGLVGMLDPVRSDVADSINAACAAGIQVKMITGDYRKTAEKIASRIGLYKENDGTLEGEEIAAMSDEELRRKVSKTSIFARIRPHEKYRIINALQENGEVTAMLGDGVNDAPALKRANIGVVVGTATDVAKETADLILLDNSFSTVVAAIEEGRIIFANVRKVVAYMLSNSFAEVLTIFIAMILKWPVPLMISQILWIHLICDGPADIVLGFEPKEGGIMKEKPKSVKDPILPKLSAILIAVISSTSAIFVLSVFHHYYNIHQDILVGRSMVFACLAINSMIYIFAYRSMRLPIYKMSRLTTNPLLIWSVLLGLGTIVIAFVIPGLRNVLGLVPLSFLQWLEVLGFAVGLLLIVEIGKAIANYSIKDKA